MATIDLRSDTVTHPTDAMRKAMATAEVGDDVLDEDPTIHKLQKLAANKMGKQSALFVPTGTMGNLISVLTHCGRGDEAILGDRSHIFLNEVGGISALGGVHPRILRNNDDGTLSLHDVEKAIRGTDLHYPPTRLICLENTHNYCSGAVLTPDYMAELAKLAGKRSLKIHLDGARVFNAAVALNRNVKDLVKHADSVMFCLSKGLSAPVGSLVCGTAEFVARARKIRKMAGGGMRQAGHLAAAGIIALQEMVGRLKEDHNNARLLADGLANIPGMHLDLRQVQTNIVFFNLDHSQIQPENFLRQLESRGTKILMTAPGRFRAVLHREITRKQVETALKTIASLLESPGKTGKNKNSAKKQ